LHMCTAAHPVCHQLSEMCYTACQQSFMCG
jgi:hypothetical protein